MAEKKRYRLLAGSHLEQDLSRPYIDADEKGISKSGANLRPMISYKAGDIIESEIDLCRKFNSPDPTFPKKFELVHDAAPMQSPITIDELIRRGISHEALLAAMERETSSGRQTVSAAAPPPAVDPVQQAAQQGFNPQADLAKYPPQPLRPLTDVFESMTKEQLKKHAEEAEVDLGNARTREEMLRIIRAAETVQASHG